MTLEHVHGPAFMARMRDAQKLVLVRAEAVADGRRNGSLSAAALDRLVEAQRELDRLRKLYITGTGESSPKTR